MSALQLDANSCVQKHMVWFSIKAYLHNPTDEEMSYGTRQK
jgi:hypothetical protein